MTETQEDPRSFEEQYPEPEVNQVKAYFDEDGDINKLVVNVDYFDVDHKSNVSVVFKIDDGVAEHPHRFWKHINSDANEIYAYLKAEDHLRSMDLDGVMEVCRLEDQLHERIVNKRMDMRDAEYI